GVDGGAERRGWRRGDAGTDVEADEISEPERSHWMVVAELHCPIDVLGTGNAFFQHANRLEPDRNAQARRREAGAVAHEDRRLAHRLRDFADRVRRVVGRPVPADDLDTLPT